MQAMTRGFSLFEEALVVLETWDLNTEQYRKVAAAIQNAIQGCRDITGLFFKRVGRIESSQKLELVPSTSVNQFSQSVMSDSATPWTAAHQVSLSITNSWSLLKPMSIKLVMPSNHLILWRPLLLPPSTISGIRVFSNESVLCIRWPKYWSFSFSISPSNEYSGLISFRMDWLDLLEVQGTLKSLLQHCSSKASVLHIRCKWCEIAACPPSLLWWFFSSTTSHPLSLLQSKNSSCLFSWCQPLYASCCTALEQ